MKDIQLCNYEEALNRIKWILICHGILWIIFGIAILVVGDAELLLLANPNDIDNTHISYKLVKLYSDTYYVLFIGIVIIIPIFLAVPKLKDYRRPMLESFTSMMLGGLIVTQIIKALVGRYRPFDQLKNIESAIIISLFSAGMMYARLFLGMHYATDVLVGSIIYVMISILTFFLFELLYSKVDMKNKHEWLIYIVLVVPFVILLALALSRS